MNLNLYNEILKISQRIKRSVNKFKLYNNLIHSNKYEFGEIYGIIKNNKSTILKELKTLECFLKINSKELYTFNKESKKGNISFDENKYEIILSSDISVNKISIPKINGLEYKDLQKIIKKFDELEYYELSSEEIERFKTCKDSTVILEIPDKLKKKHPNFRPLKINEKIFITLNKTTKFLMALDSPIIKVEDPKICFYYKFHIIKI